MGINNIGIHIGITGYLNAILRFNSDINTEHLIEFLTSPTFNEFDFVDDISGTLESYGINHTSSEVFKLDERVSVNNIRMWEEEERYTTKIASNYDIYIDIIQEHNENETTQYVYVYSEEWGKSRCIIHTARVGENGEFSNEEYVSSLSLKQKPYKFSLNADVNTQNNTSCPYYDKYAILKYIKNIDNCEDLVDYAGTETEEKLRAGE